MTNNNSFDGEMHYAIVKYLPSGKMKIDALLEGVQLADQAKDPYWQQFFRFVYACELSKSDDPAKVIPLAAEFGTLYEEHPHAMPESGGQEAYLMITELAIDAIVDLPQIPKAQWEELMERYYTLVKRFHMGYRTYWHQMARFWEYIDKDKAYEYFQTLQNTPRDIHNDCEACQRGFAVHMSLMIGDRKAAKHFAKPIKSGALSCHDVPQVVWKDYLENALDRGALTEAIPLAEKLYRIADRDKSDLSYLGAVVRCWAYSNLDKAVEIVSQRLEWTLGTWNQRMLYDFYKGAWVCFRELAKRQETVKLNLPDEFVLYQKDGVYHCSALAQWFHAQAETIAQRFDQRNGTNYFVNNLALVRLYEPQKHGLQ